MEKVLLLHYLQQMYIFSFLIRVELPDRHQTECFATENVKSYTPEYSLRIYNFFDVEKPDIYRTYILAPYEPQQSPLILSS